MTRRLFSEFMLAVEGKTGRFSEFGGFAGKDDGGPGFGKEEKDDDEEEAEDDKLKRKHNP